MLKWDELCNSVRQTHRRLFTERKKTFVKGGSLVAFPGLQRSQGEGRFNALADS